jgi:hypothetical protein
MGLGLRRVECSGFVFLTEMLDKSIEISAGSYRFDSEFGFSRE